MKQLMTTRLQLNGVSFRGFEGVRYPIRAADIGSRTAAEQEEPVFSVTCERERTDRILDFSRWNDRPRLSSIPANMERD